MNQIAERVAGISADAGIHLESQLDALRLRLAELRARLLEKQEAEDRASDAALGELDHAIDDLYDTLVAGPK